jgi:hypothetical protein
MGKLMSSLIRSGPKSNLLELIGRVVSPCLLAAFAYPQRVYRLLGKSTNKQ